MTSKMFTIAALAAAGFWRCGKLFPKEGITVAIDEFTQEQWDRLKAEKMLKVTEGGVADGAPDERIARITDAIGTLSAGDFQGDGKPKLDALRTLLGEDLGKINSADRDAAWSDLIANGFSAPAKSAT